MLQLFLKPFSSLQDAPGPRIGGEFEGNNGNTEDFMPKPKHGPLNQVELFNPISAGVLENQDMLGVVKLTPPPLKPMFVQI